MNKWRVLVISSTYPRWENDTTPSFVHHLNTRLTSLCEVEVLAPHAKNTRSVEVLDGVKVHRFRYAPESLELLAYGGGIAENIRRNKWLLLLIPSYVISLFSAIVLLQLKRPYNLIHAHWLIPQGVLAAIVVKLMPTKVPLVLTSHGADIFGFNDPVSRFAKKIAIKQASKFTIVSSAMGDEVGRLGAEKEVLEIISMGVDVDLFSPDKDKRREKTILFVGRLVQKKGVSVLIEALAILKERGVACELDVIGSGPSASELKQLANQLGVGGQVRFLGAKAQSELPEYYRKAALVAVPSIVAVGGDQEGLGLVAVEAMACECAVVASALPALRTVITHGANGFLFEPGNSHELSQCIETAITNVELCESIGATARKSVIGRFAWERVANRYQDIYKSLLLELKR